MVFFSFYLTVTQPDILNIDVKSTDRTFILTTSLNNFVPEGLYNITATLTWEKFLHSCNRMGSSHMIDEPYSRNDMERTITGLIPNSEYTITVVISNAIGNITINSVNSTLEAGKMTFLKPEA